MGQRAKGRRGGKGSCRGRPCDQQLEFQQSQLVTMEAPQFQFIDILLGFPVLSRDGYAQCKLRSRPSDFSRCRSWTRLLAIVLEKVADVPVVQAWWCRRCSSCGCGRRCDHAVTSSGPPTVEVPQIQFILPFGDIPVVQQRLALDLQ